MKTFYNYDTRENKLILKVLMVTAVGAGIAGLVSLIWGIFLEPMPGVKLIYIVLAAILGFIVPVALNTRKDFEYKFKNESFVAHDWGVEYEREGAVREVKWDKIVNVNTTHKRILFLKNSEHLITISQEEPILFYSSLENADFLVNYIKKNLAKRADELNKVTMTKQDLLMERIMRKD